MSIVKTEQSKTTVTSKNPKEDALKAALAQIEKQYGAGSIMRMGEDRAIEIERVPSGSLSLDIALGGGGSWRPCH
jgi:recombination protein RecA